MLRRSQVVRQQTLTLSFRWFKSNRRNQSPLYYYELREDYISLVPLFREQVKRQKIRMKNPRPVFESLQDDNLQTIGKSSGYP